MSFGARHPQPLTRAANRLNIERDGCELRIQTPSFYGIFRTRCALRHVWRRANPRQLLRGGAGLPDLNFVQIRACGAAKHEVVLVGAMLQGEGMPDLVGTDAGDRFVNAAGHAAQRSRVFDEHGLAEINTIYGKPFDIIQVKQVCPFTGLRPQFEQAMKFILVAQFRQTRQRLFAHQGFQPKADAGLRPDAIHLLEYAIHIGVRERGVKRRSIRGTEQMNTQGNDKPVLERKSLCSSATDNGNNAEENEPEKKSHKPSMQPTKWGCKLLSLAFPFAVGSCILPAAV